MDQKHKHTLYSIHLQGLDTLRARFSLEPQLFEFTDYREAPIPVLNGRLHVKVNYHINPLCNWVWRPACSCTPPCHCLKPSLIKSCCLQLLHGPSLSTSLQSHVFSYATFTSLFVQLFFLLLPIFYSDEIWLFWQFRLIITSDLYQPLVRSFVTQTRIDAFLQKWSSSYVTNRKCHICEMVCGIKIKMCVAAVNIYRFVALGDGKCRHQLFMSILWTLLHCCQWRLMTSPASTHVNATEILNGLFSLMSQIKDQDVFIIIVLKTMTHCLVALILAEEITTR